MNRDWWDYGIYHVLYRGFGRQADGVPPLATTKKQQPAQRLIEANEKNIMNEINMNFTSDLKRFILSSAKMRNRSG